jgi:hypothetical protein
MADEEGRPVLCRVSHEALEDHADRVHSQGTDTEVFDAYRELIEPIASGCPFRKSYPDVLVMQPSQDRNGENGARSLDRSMRGRILL